MRRLQHNSERRGDFPLEESEGSGRNTNEEKERRKSGQQGLWQLPEDITMGCFAVKS